VAIGGGPRGILRTPPKKQKLFTGRYSVGAEGGQNLALNARHSVVTFVKCLNFLGGGGKARGAFNKRRHAQGVCEWGMPKFV